MEDGKAVVNKEQAEVKVIDEVSRKKEKNNGNGRGNSVSILKTMSSTTNFDNTSHQKDNQSVEISRIYQTSNKRDKSLSKSQ